ncbi:MAG: AmmeMemoRadiSam system radical SAM enzyme [Clostridiales bacterium]|nr:AmmeMemoRadiSam system radical SAM enzyme [Clostridiales bacterium]
MKVKCEICPIGCNLSENQTGVCRARANVDNEIISLNYGRVSSIMLDPISKKPLARFHPGSYILSVGSYGCNLHCPFCQNYQIALEGEDLWVEQTGKYFSTYETIMPKELVKLAVAARDRGNIGIAFTYNEPLVGYEYVYDTSLLAKEAGLKTVIVTNGYFNHEPFEEIMKITDAINIDIKGFTEEFYKKVGGDLQTVLNNVKIASKYCHVEITNLIIPGENDSEEEMEQLSRFLKEINPEIPLHISRFFPNYKMLDKNPTERDVIDRLSERASKNLKYVYKGNY